MTFKVTLAPASGKAVSVDYADAGTGTATSATDYAAITADTLNFAAGQTEKTVNVTVNGDTTDEPNESVVVRLSSPNNAALSGGSQTLDGTGTINDDDGAPTVSISNASAVNEGNDPNTTVDMSFTVSLSAASGKAITVPYTLTGTATDGSDYETPASTSLLIPAGNATGTIVIKVKGDTVDEPNETIIVTLNAPTHATVSSTQGAGTATGTINDDDAAPTVSIADASAVNEGNDPDTTVDMSFTVTLSAASAKAITVPYTLTGTATGGTDYETPASTSLSIPAGIASGTIVIKVKGDTEDEPNETIIITLSSPTHATVANTEGANKGTGTITDDDGTPTVTLALSSNSITENGGSSTVTATMNGTSSQAVTLTVNATAVSPAVTGDLTLSANKTLTIAAGATNSTGIVTLTAVDNDVDAPNKTFNVSAKANGGNGVTDPTSATLTITDDDTRGVTVAGGPLTMAEVDNSETDDKEHQASYTVVLDSEPTDDVQINLTTPSMVTLNTTQLTFTASNWNQSQTVTATAVNDDIDNTGDRRTDNIAHTVVAGSSDYTNVSAASVAVTVNDDDGEPALSIDSPRVAEGDNGTTTMTFKVTLAPASGKAVSVDYADAGTGTATSATDYAAISAGTLNFAAGQTEKTVNVTVNGDTVDEPNETVVLRLSSPSNAKLTGGSTTLDGIGTITDDDTAPTISVANATAVKEGNDPDTTVDMSFTVSLSAASGKAITVPYTLTGTATGGSDYEAPVSTGLSIPAGSESGTIVIKVKGDTLDEPDETIIVTLGVPTHATVSSTQGAGTASGTINDDDAAPSVSIANAAAVNEGNDPNTTVNMSFTVSVSAASAKAITVPYTLTGTATSGSDYETPVSTSLSIPAGDTSGAIVIKVKGDVLDEPNETIIVTLDAPTHATVSNTEGAGTGTITDDDGTPTVALALSSNSIIENGGSSTVTATMNGTSSQAVTLTVGATAVSPAVTGDLTLSANNTLTIAAGATTSSGTVTLTAVDNDVDAPNKTFNVSAKANGGNGVTDPTSATLTITDDDTRGVTVAGGPLSMAEVDNTETDDKEHQASYTVVLDSEPTDDVRIDISAPDMVTLNAEKLTFTPSNWNQAQTVTVTAVNDTADNPGDIRTGTITHTVVAGSSDYSGETAASVVVTVNDDDGEPALSINSPSVTEGNSGTRTMTFKVTLAPASGKAVSVDYADANTGTAISATDYATITAGTLNFAAGDTEKTVSVTVNGDELDEPNETVVLRLSSASNAALSGGKETLDGTGTITDDDATPTVTLKLSSSSITENDGTSTVTATMSGTSSQAVTLTVGATAISPAVEGNLTLSSNKTLTIAAGSTTSTGTVTLTAADNDVDAPNKTFKVSADASGGNNVANPDSVALTITDDDTRGISVSPVALTLAEMDDPLTENTSENQKTYKVKLDSAPTGTVTVNLSSGDTKIATLSDTSLEFTPSDWGAQTVTVTAVPDALDNAGDVRTVQITHTVSAAGTDYADESAAPVNVTVTDDDDAPTLSIDSPSITEGDKGAKTMTFTVTLSAASGKPVSVDYADAGTGTATSATDYAAISSGTLTFTAGETETTVDVTVNGDTTDEPNETVVVRLSSASNAALSGGKATLDGTGMINDDDAEPTVSVSDATAVNEGNDPNTTVNMSFTVRLSAASAKAITVPYTLTGTATSGSDYETPLTSSLSIPAGSESGTIVIKVKGDTLDETNETIIVTLDAPTHASVASTEGAGTGTGTITDDDDTPTVALKLSSNSISENGGTSTVTATMSGASSQAVTLTVGATAVSPAVAGDLTLSGNNTLTIAAGATNSTGIVTLTSVDNDVDAANKTFTISADASGGNGVGDPANTTLTITDDDTRGVTVAGGPLTMAEVDNPKTDDKEHQASYTVVLDSEPTDNVQINISAPNMVTVSPARLTFTPTNWNQAQTVTATAVNDDIDNTGNARTGDITHTVAAGSSDYNDVKVSDVAVTVNDDDATPGGITLSVDQTSITEDAATATVTVTATVSGGTTYASAQTVKVTVGDDADSATEGTDYANVAGFDIVIEAGSTSASKGFSLDPEDDVLDENTESLSIKGESGDLTIGGASIDITDNDDAPTITLSVSTAEVSEDDDPTEITVTATLGGGTRFASQKTLEVTAGTFTPGEGEAKAGTDHRPVSRFDLTIAAGAASGEAEFTLILIDDTIFEPSEQVPVNGELTGVTVAGTAVTINEDDSEPTALTFEAKIGEGDASHEVAENVSTPPTITVTATLTGDVTFSTAKTVTVTVGYSDDSATKEDDYEAVEEFTFDIAAETSSGTGTFTFTPVDDAIDEEDESVSINGALPDSDSVALASITITDNDTRGISVSPVTLTLGEVDNPETQNISEHQKTYTVALDSEPTGTVTVNLSSGDTKIATISDTSLEFTPSDWGAQTVTVTAVPDALDNAGDVRTVQITHTVSAAGTDYADESAAPVNVTVTDDDDAPTLSIDSPSITEGDKGAKTMTFTVTLSAASGKPVSVDYADAGTGTATSATDYAAISSGTLTFTAGETETTVDVTVNGDTTDEPNETVVVRLSSASNAALSGGKATLDGTGMINDDDAEPTVSVSDATAVNEGNDPNTTVNMSFTVRLSAASAQGDNCALHLNGYGNKRQRLRDAFDVESFNPGGVRKWHHRHQG